MLSGEWNSPCTAPLPDMDYMDCPMVDDIEKFVVDAQTGKGKLISGFDNLTFEVPIEIIRLQKDLGIVIHGKDQVSTGRIVKLTDKELIVNFEDEAYAKIWKRP